MLEVIKNGDHDFTDADAQVIKQIDAQRILRTKDSINIESFSAQIIDGHAPLLERGKLGLVAAHDQANVPEDTFVCL